MNLELFEALNTVYTYQTVGQDNGVDTSWVFDNGTQKLGMKMAAIKPGALKKFKPAERIAQFFLFRVSETGKTGGAPKTIFKPLQTIGTLASILGAQCQEHKLNAFVVRFPKEMDGNSLIGLMQRVLNKTSKVRYEQKGFYTFDGLQYSYAIFVKQGKDVTETVFGNVWSKYLVHQDVLEYAASFTMSSVELKKVQKKAEIVSGIVRALDAQNTRMATPPKVDITTIAGGNDIPEEVAEFDKLNPSVYKLDKPMSDYKAFDSSEIDFYKNGGNDTLADLFSGRVSDLKTIYDDETFEPEAKQNEWKMKFVNQKLTAADIASGQATEFIEKWVIEGVSEGWMPDYIAPGGKANIADAIQDISRGYIHTLSTGIRSSYTALKTSYVADGPDRDAVREYTSNAYITMNNGLLKGEDYLDEYSKEQIRQLDKAFINSGVRLPEDTILYRGMRMDKMMLLDTIKGKAFHFRTFVSTSLRPDLSLYSFNGEFAIHLANQYATPGPMQNPEHIARSMTPDEVTGALELDRDKEEMGTSKINVNTFMAMIVRDGYKIPVIVPGTHSSYAEECEIILPRGTTMRVNDFNFSRSQKQYGAGNHDLYGVIDMSIMGKNEIKLNEVYDGDHFVKTGEVKKMGFSQFNESRKIPKKTKFENTSKFFSNAMESQLRKNGNTILTKKEKEERARLAMKFGGQLLTDSDY